MESKTMEDSRKKKSNQVNPVDKIKYNQALFNLSDRTSYIPVKRYFAFFNGIQWSLQ